MRTIGRNPLILALVGGLAAATITATAAARTSSSVTPPPAIKSAGKIVWCSDVEYPPEEYYNKQNKAVGSDIDIANAVGNLMGVKTQIKNIVFDSIIPALLTKKCDAIISGMNDTPTRRKQVDFVDYLKVGQTLAVKKGNPEHITSLADLSGKRVSVQAATTNRDFLVAQSKKLVAKSKKGITIVTFPKDSDAAAALKAGKVDAYFADSPVVIYYAGIDKSIGVGVSPIAPIPIGIAIRKKDPLRPAVQKAINTMYANGSLKQIVAKWGMTSAVAFLKK
jgi:polar amino acid transport system substrate-binding protein